MSRDKNQLWLFDSQNDYAKKKIVIIWVGWVWSVSAYYIAQMWCQNITIVDMDEVEIHNTASQFYGSKDLGKSKVLALQENIKMFTAIEVTAINWEYNIEQIKGADIVLCAVDNMDVRKQVVEDCFMEDVGYVVESRMSWEDYMLFAFDPLTQKDRRLEYRHPASESLPEICTMKSISYNTGAIGSHVAKLFKNYLTKSWENAFLMRVDGMFKIEWEF